MSRKQNPRLGSKVRNLRRRHGHTQAQLAESLGISASYLNLIEHDRRPLTAPLLIKLAQRFDLDLQTFSEDRDAHVMSNLLEVFGDPMFEPYELTNVEIREMTSSCSATARAVVALYRAYRQARESVDALAATLSEGDQLESISRVQLPSEEVSDVFQQHRNHFPPLEEAAEELWGAAELRASELASGLARHLRDTFGIEVDIRSPQAMRGAMRRYDERLRLLTLSEVLRSGSRCFQMAHMIGLLSLSDELDRIADGEPLSSSESRTLCRIALANYFAGAVVMPYSTFLDAAQRERYDVELLGHRFNASFEQVCHRLTTLQRPSAQGVPLHLIRIDIAGNISKRFSDSGLRISRFSASCPLWNVHSAFLTPGQMRLQISRMQGGDTYFCLARTLLRGGGGYHSPQALQALAIGCEISHARAMVYSDGIDLDHADSVIEVGVTCRLCQRADCPQRAVPPILHPLRVEENVRGVSFFAPIVSDES